MHPPACGHGSIPRFCACGCRSFDEARGLECAQALSAETLSPDLQSRYLALGSLAALLQYLQQIQQMGLAARTLRFVWREPRGRMSLDYETVRIIPCPRALVMPKMPHRCSVPRSRASNFWSTRVPEITRRACSASSTTRVPASVRASSAPTFSPPVMTCQR